MTVTPAFTPVCMQKDTSYNVLTLHNTRATSGILQPGHE